MTQPILLLDCDTGIDDALALIYLAALHRQGRIRLAGITTTAGNTHARTAAANTRFILQRAGVATAAASRFDANQVPLAPGCEGPRKVELVTTPETHGPKGLGYVDAGEVELSDGSWREIWRRALAQDAHLIVTGPATNAAAWLEENPAPERITVMGGAFDYPGNTTETAEWNSWVDPHAAAELYTAYAQAGGVVQACGLDVTSDLVMTPHRLAESIEILGTHPLGEILEPMLRFYFEFHQSVDEGYQAKVHDLLAVMVAIGAVDFGARKALVTVDTEGPRRGTTNADFTCQAQPNTSVVTTVDLEQCWQQWYSALEWLAAN